MGRGRERRRLPAVAVPADRRAALGIVSGPDGPVVMRVPHGGGTVEVAVLLSVVNDRPVVLVLPEECTDPAIAGGPHGLSTVPAMYGPRPGTILAEISSIFDDAARSLAWLTASRLPAHRTRGRRSGTFILDPQGRAYFAAFILEFAIPGSAQERDIHAVNPLARQRRERCVSKLLVIAHGPHGDRREIVMDHVHRCRACALADQECGASGFAFTLLGGLTRGLASELALDPAFVRTRAWRSPTGPQVTHPMRSSSDARLVTEADPASRVVRVGAHGLTLVEFTLDADVSVPCPYCPRRPCGHDAIFEKFPV